MSRLERVDAPIHVTAWGRTDPGRERSENQDTFLVLELDGGARGENGFLLDPSRVPGERAHRREFELDSGGALLLVADGMGGAVGGATASRGAAEEIRRRLRERWADGRDRSPRAFASHLKAAVEAANETLRRTAAERPELDGMGTTATAVGILRDEIYLAQVGDSRAYLIRDGDAVQLTRDQSVVQELLDAKALTEEEAARSPQRNVILQALGTAPTVEVDLTRQQLRRGDTILLCSDGLSGLVERGELASAAARLRDPATLCEALVELANSRGAPDNVTVVVARVDGPGLAPPAPGDHVRREVFEVGGG